MLKILCLVVRGIVVGEGGHAWFGMLGGLMTCAREVAGDFGQIFGRD